jgi:hypothetical protein
MAGMRTLRLLPDNRRALSYNAGMPRQTRPIRRLARLSLALVVALAAPLTTGGCSKAEPEAGTALQVTDVVTGWFDAGIVNGQNKLVPTISFKLKNGADRAISSVDLNSVFRVIGDEEQLGSKFVRGIDRTGLAPGGSVGPFVLRSDLGYTSEAPRMQMLQNSQFKDAQVQVFAKHGSSQWVRLAEITIQRQLLTQ